MSRADHGSCAGGALRSEKAHAAALRAVDWLHLAATPTFASMALLTAAFGVGPPDMLCSATPHALPMDGMVVMYVLMSAFHSTPWLKLISSPANGDRRP